MPSPIRALAVVHQAVGPTTPEKKRHITPSAADEPCPERSLVLVSPAAQGSVNLDENGRLSVTPFFAPKQLFPSGAARVAQDFALRSDSGFFEVPPTWQSRHILLPFDLRGARTDILEDKDILDLLRNIFPGTTEVGSGRYGAYLFFIVREMPKEPWPLTVGGLPITISDGTKGRGPLFPLRLLRFGKSANSIWQHLDKTIGTLSDSELQSITGDLHREVRMRCPNIRLIEVIFSSERLFLIILGDGANITAVRNRLPGKIANCPAGYFYERELNRPTWADNKAQRDVLPQPVRGVEDDTAYNTLRPGVMVRSTKYRTHAHPAELRTTSGVMVKNGSGHHFMTAASHGIREEETLFQRLPGDQKRVLGKAVHEISFTDVAIVNLHDDIQFSTELFENEDGTTPQITRLLGEEEGDEINFGNMVFINSPFTGNMEGTVLAKSAKIEHEPPKHNTEDSLRYVIYSWTFLGQVDGAEDPNGPRVPPDGTCGSVIIDEDNRVLGFFRYYIKEGPWAGWCAAVSAREVVKAGYRLA